MTNYADLEEDIRARLSSLESEMVAVVVLPELESQYATPVKGKARITIAAGDTQGEQINDVHLTTQDAPNTVRVMIQSTTLRGQGTGIYLLEQAVRLLLLGYKPANHSTKLRYVKGNFVEIEHQTSTQVWSFQVEYMAKGVLVQHDDEDLVDVLVSQITNVSYFDTVVTTGDDEIDGGFSWTIYDDTDTDGGGA